MTAFEDTFDTTRDTLVFYLNESRNILLINIATEYADEEVEVNDSMFKKFRNDSFYMSVRESTFEKLDEFCNKGVL